MSSSTTPLKPAWGAKLLRWQGRRFPPSFVRGNSPLLRLLETASIIADSKRSFPPTNGPNCLGAKNCGLSPPVDCRFTVPGTNISQMDHLKRSRIILTISLPLGVRVFVSIFSNASFHSHSPESVLSKNRNSKKYSVTPFMSGW